MFSFTVTLGDLEVTSVHNCSKAKWMQHHKIPLHPCCSPAEPWEHGGVFRSGSQRWGRCQGWRAPRGSWCDCHPLPGVSWHKGTHPLPNAPSLALLARPSPQPLPTSVAPCNRSSALLSRKKTTCMEAHQPKAHFPWERSHSTHLALDCPGDTQSHLPVSLLFLSSHDNLSGPGPGPLSVRVSHPMTAEKTPRPASSTSPPLGPRSTEMSSHQPPVIQGGEAGKQK